MKKHKKNNHAHRRRNAAAGPTAAPSRPRPRASLRPRRPQVAPPPSMETILAAVAGGGAGALGGSYLAAERGWNPKLVGAGLGILGTIGAMKLGGGWRVASMGTAAAGAGQAVLALWDDEDYTGPKQKPAQSADKPSANDNQRVATARQARRGGEGLDRAFNRIRERLHSMYENDDVERFVEEGDAA